MEQEIAREMGGKRMVQSGGSVLRGGDLVFPAGHIFSDFTWEIKSRKKVPEIIKLALAQAELETVGSLKKPAAIIKADNEAPVVCIRLADFIEWTGALAEMGSGHAVKSLVRDMRRLLDEVERLT